MFLVLNQRQWQKYRARERATTESGENSASSLLSLVAIVVEVEPSDNWDHFICLPSKCLMARERHRDPRALAIAAPQTLLWRVMSAVAHLLLPLSNCQDIRNHFLSAGVQLQSAFPFSRSLRSVIAHRSSHG